VLVNASQSSDASPLNSVSGSATMQEHIGFRARVVAQAEECMH
jgi:hypothetical protein